MVFSDEPSGLVKRVAKYHQMWAVNAAIESTIEAAADDAPTYGASNSTIRVSNTPRPPGT